MSDGSIPILRPGETAGPFEIEIPREVIWYLTFMEKTTRWERFRLKTKLMRRARRREVYGRLRPLYEYELGLATNRPRPEK